MKKARYKFVFNRRNKLNKAGAGSIELRITIVKNVLFISTGIYILPSQWNENKGEINSTLKNYRQINSYLFDLKNKIEQFEILKQTQNEEFNIEILKEFIKDADKTIDKSSFIDFCLEELEKDNSISVKSKRNNMVSIMAFKEFSPNCTFKDINFELIQKFDYFVRNKPEVNSQNTVHKYHKFIKKYINLAVKKDLIQKSPYLHFKVKTSPTTRTSLEKDELIKIENFKADKNLLKITPDIEEIRDFFVFACYTGLRYSDLKQLERDCFKTTNEGLILELTKQQKTEKPLYLPLYLLFEGKPENIIKPYIFREGRMMKRNDMYINKALKYIALNCGINKNLTLHVARHTFGTMLATITGDPFVIQDLMSHSDIKTSMNYIHLSRERKNETLKRIVWNK